MSVIPASSLSNLATVQPTDQLIITRDGIELLRATIAALFDSPAMSGNPTAPTQTAGNSSERLANTAFVGTAIGNALGDLTTDDVEDVSGRATDSPPSLTSALLALQPQDVNLDAISALTMAADKLIYFTSSSGAATADFTSAARTLLAQSSQASMRSTGLGLGTAAVENTGTSGAVVPLLNGANTWSANQTVSIAGGGSVQFEARGEGSTVNNLVTKYINSSGDPAYNVQKARGTISIPAAVSNFDGAGSINFNAYGGSSFVTAARIRAIIRETTPSETVMGADLRFFANAIGGVALGEVLRLSLDTGISFNGANVIVTPTMGFRPQGGSATAGTAPLKFTSGTRNTAAEAGAIEYDNNFYAAKNGNVRLGIGGTIGADEYADANNGTTVETDLYSNTVLATTLGTNGGALEFEVGGVTAGHATATRRIRAKFDGTTFFDSGASGFTSAAAGVWNLSGTLIRDSSTSLRCIGVFTFNGSSTIVLPFAFKLTGTGLSADRVLLITGQAGGVGAASNDITAYAMKCKYLAPEGV